MVTTYAMRRFAILSVIGVALFVCLPLHAQISLGNILRGTNPYVVFFSETGAALLGTTVTLYVSPAMQVASETVVTLTATVLSGATPVTPGQVSFCDTSVNTRCTDAALLATAQLISNGTATVKLRLGIGSHSLQAMFAGTVLYSPASSSKQQLTVTGKYATVTSISSAAGNTSGTYNLTATVLGLSRLSPAPAPSGTVDFVDTSKSNDVLTSVPLTAGNYSLLFRTPQNPSVGEGPQSLAVGDFNGDGKPDLIAVNDDGTISVLLGNGDGTFQAQKTYSSGVPPLSVIVGDFNNDGKLDLAVPSGGDTVLVLLGNGNGTFQTEQRYLTGHNSSSATAGDFNGDGNLDLVVTSQSDDIVSVLLGNGDGTFQTQQTYPTGNNPGPVTVGDFNGDGKPDLAVANDDDSTISILLGNGDGTFQTQRAYATSSTPSSVAVGDFNGDGNLDLAVGYYYNGNNISVLLGNGDGTFRTQQTYAAGHTPYLVTVGDFNGDGKLDLATANDNDSNVSVLLGNGDGTFQTQQTYGTGRYPHGITVGDFNGDGKIDVATASYGGKNVSVLLNAGGISATATAMGISFADLSGDHLVDASYDEDANYAASTSSTISVAANGYPTVLALTSSANPSDYASQITLTATLSPYSGSGHNTNGEIVTFYNGSTSVGTGTLSSGVATLNISFLPIGTDTLTATFPGDPYFANATSNSLVQTVQLVVSKTAVALAVTSSGSPVKTVASGTVVTLTATVLSGATEVRPGQVNFCDAAVNTHCTDAALLGTAQLISNGTATVKLRLGIGSHSLQAVFAGTILLSPASSSKQALTVTGKYGTTSYFSTLPGAAGAWNLTATVGGEPRGPSTPGPGGTVSFLDTSNSNYSLASATLSAGSSSYVPNFTFSSFPPADGLAASVVMGDFNGDGKLDLAVAEDYYNDIVVLLGNGDGTFQTEQKYPTGPSPFSVVLGDFNGDGKLDLAVANKDDNTVSVLLGNGDGTFQTQQTYATGDSPYSVTLGDFNGDGNLDLATANINDNTVSVLLGNADGTFQSQLTYPAGFGPWSVTAGDFNGDGKLDLVTTDYDGNSVSVLLGNGDGIFQSPVTYPAGLDPHSLAVGDFNGDGKLDLAVVSGSNTVSVLLGNGDGSFQPQVPYSTGNGPISVAVGNGGDGKLFLTTANYDGNSVSVLLGNGDGTFQKPLTYSIANSPTSVAAGDLNGDGRPDLALASSGAVLVLLNTGLETTTATATGVSILPVGSGGSHEVEASYSGDTYYAASTSTTMPLTAIASKTSLTLVSSANPSTYNSPILLTATLSPYSNAYHRTDGEAIAFYDGSALLSAESLTSGVATLRLSSLPIGTHTLQAVFPLQDIYFAASTSNPLVQTVNKVTPVISWAPPAAITYGTALSTAQLNASASVPGRFTYSPAAGIILSAGTQTLNVTFTPTDTNIYAATTTSLSIVVNRAALTVIAANASRVYGMANPAFTGIVAGAVNGDSFAVAGTTSATASSNVGSYAIVPSVTGAHISDYTLITKDGTLTITPAASTVILTTSSTNLNLNENVTFTATVASATTGTPGGAAEFLDDSTVLGTAVLNVQGAATYTTSSLGVGAHTITAIYAGNQNFLGAKGTVSEQVTAPAFVITADPATLTLRPGETGVLQVTFAPVGGYMGTVTYACVGLPDRAACSFTPPASVADGSNKPLTTTLTISTQGSNQGTVSLARLPSKATLAAFWFLPAGALGMLLLWQRRTLSLRAKQMLIVLALLAGAIGVIGCSYGPETPTGNSTVKITATGANNVTQSTTFTLTVMQ